jgi:hypothetical protein
MVNYEAIHELVNQIPVDTWKLLREIKHRRPAMTLSELIDCSRPVSQQPERTITNTGASQSRVRTLGSSRSSAASR